MRDDPGKVRRLTAVLAAGRRWLRSCADCRAYLHFESGPDAGKVETYPQPDGKGGAVHLPVLRPDNDPPCDECPKIAPDEPHKHWSKATEFEPWFWTAWQWFEEGRACGTLSAADPLMRRVVAVLDWHREKLAARAYADPILSFLAQALGG